MKKYIISLENGDRYNAAGKAREDAEAVALRMGYEPFRFGGERSANRSVIAAVPLVAAAFANWFRLIYRVEKGSMILVQYPHYPLKTARLMRRLLPLARATKGLRVTFLIHDLNSLRGTFGRAAVYSDRYLLPAADALLCHNDRMRAYLAERGVPREKLISLGLFDYLSPARPRPHGIGDGLAVAGNLDPEKCGYIRELIRLHAGRYPLYLYGKGLPKGLADSSYRGAFSPEELPGILEGAFGLVWDGPSADTCAGKAGEYLRVNDPHKLSLYLTAGMPVIVWEEAAVADIVTRNGLGMTVRSLSEIEGKLKRLSGEAYWDMLEHVRAFRSRLQGSMLTEALRKAEHVGGGTDEGTVHPA